MSSSEIELEFEDIEIPWAGNHCRAGCLTRDHYSWGECARASNFHALVGDTVHANRRLEHNLAEYRKVRAQGIQPQSIRRPFVEASKRAADA